MTGEGPLPASPAGARTSSPVCDRYLVGCRREPPDGATNTPVLSRNAYGATWGTAVSTAAGSFAGTRAVAPATAGGRIRLHNGRLPLRGLVAFADALH